MRERRSKVSFGILTNTVFRNVGNLPTLFANRCLPRKTKTAQVTWLATYIVSRKLDQ